MNETAEKIKQSINMYDILTHYGFKLHRRNSMCCPFHREKTASFKIYRNGKRYHCFGCGTDGDVIGFVMKYFNLSYGQAISRLSNDFGISIPGIKKVSLHDKAKVQRELRQRELQREAELQEHDRLLNAYNAEVDELVRLQMYIRQYTPKSPSDTVNKTYIEAINKLPYQKYKCDMAETELQEYEERSGHNAADSSAGICQRGLSARVRTV